MGVAFSVFFIFFVYFLIFAVAVGSQLLLAFCVYYDAKLHGIKEAKLWAVLSGFFTVAGIIYLIIRGDSKKNPVQCPACFAWLSADYRTCARCGHPREENGAPIALSQYEQWERRRKLLFIWWIVSLVVPVMLALVWVCLIVIFAILGVSAEYMALGLFV